MTSTQQPVSTPLTQDEQIDQLGRYKFGWADADVAGASARARTSTSSTPTNHRERTPA